jgi:hypothetical protein
MFEICSWNLNSKTEAAFEGSHRGFLLLLSNVLCLPFCCLCVEAKFSEEKMMHSDYEFIVGTIATRGALEIWFQMKSQTW